MIKRGFIGILLLFANLCLMAQVNVTGVVRDEANQPVPGVSVVVVGTSIGTLTDAEGRYSISVPVGDNILAFTFIGMTRVEEPVGNRTVINVTLQEEMMGLDEVVVVGYGTQKKKVVTGATVQVKGEDIQKLTTVSPLTALQGQTPGVTIIKNTGE
ncbi:MAG: carboxypeptidase-like regulatory domain-containing protein, partial [Bacteroidales bacterium]|nr:carboxypeptidase-like regulatory domain-containing protein [Bacteroidales bacterium]